MNKLRLAIASLVLTLVAACGGGGGGTTTSTPASTAGSISGTTTPGAIVGITCVLNGAGQAVQYCAVPAFTVIADASGQYSFTGITQMGVYGIGASHGGYSSVWGNSCDFTYGAPYFFDCQMSAGSLIPYTYPPTNGFPGISFYNTVNGMDAIANTSSSNGLASGNFTTGARVVTQGAFYEWDDSFGNHSTLSYDSAHGTISVVLVPSSTPSGDGVICSVSSSVNVNGIWYYPCSDLGITFDSAAGTITFATTPIYHAVGVLGVAYPYSDVIASGSLTFPPF